MVFAGEGSDLLSYTKKRMKDINRGGLFLLNDETFHLFIEIEKNGMYNAAKPHFGYFITRGY